MIFSSTLFFVGLVNIGYYSLISIIYTHIIVFQKVVLYSNPFVGHKTDNIFSFFTPIRRSEIDMINEYNIKIILYLITFSEFLPEHNIHKRHKKYLGIKTPGTMLQIE